MRIRSGLPGTEALVAIKKNCSNNFDLQNSPHLLFSIESQSQVVFQQNSYTNERVEGRFFQLYTPRHQDVLELKWPEDTRTELPWPLGFNKNSHYDLRAHHALLLRARLQIKLQLRVRTNQCVRQ